MKKHFISKLAGILMLFILSLCISIPSEATSNKVKVLTVGESVKYTGYVSSKTTSKKIVTLTQKKNSCKIKAKKKGECTVTLTNKKGKKKKVDILVTEKNPYFYDTNKITLEIGKSKTFKATAPSACTVTYTSSDENVATVDKNGKITGKRLGTAKIKVSISYKGKELEIFTKKVSVKDESTTNYSNICKSDGSVIQSQVKLANEELQKLPSSLLQKFVESKWQIIITSNNLNKYMTSKNITSEVIGLTSYDNKIIYVKAGDTNIEQSLIHEMGHWVNNYIGSYSSTTEWGNIYNKENLTFLTTFGSSDISYWNKSEFFAEAFWRYFDKNAKLEKNCPETYKAIKNVLAKF